MNFLLMLLVIDTLITLQCVAITLLSHRVAAIKMELMPLAIQLNKTLI